MEITAGFSEMGGPGKEMRQAVRQASIALRQARKSPGFFDIYSPQYEQTVDRERELVERLETALELDEMQLYLQPNVHAGYHSLVGAEALTIEAFEASYGIDGSSSVAHGADTGKPRLLT